MQVGFLDLDHDEAVVNESEIFYFHHGCGFDIFTIGERDDSGIAASHSALHLIVHELVECL